MHTGIKKTVIVVLVAACAVISLSFAALVYLDLNHTTSYSNKEIATMAVQKTGMGSAEGPIRYWIDSVEFVGNAYIIKGWLHKIGENMGYVNNRIVLYDAQANAYIGIPTQRVDRPEIESVHGAGFGYRNGGFLAKVKTSKLSDIKNYEICMLYRSGHDANPSKRNNILVKTGYMLGGKISGFQVQSVPSLPKASAQTADYWIGKNGICLDTYNGKYISNADTFSIYKDAAVVSLVGWAADFKYRRPLSALYLNVGDKIIQCIYGIERTSVSDHYHDNNLKNTGFSVTFPVSYLRGGEIEEISFIQIGSGGTYQYEPVTYKLQYN